jgi:DNA repair photolyase
MAAIKMNINPAIQDKLRTNYTSPRWSGEVLDCSMPMTFDQYSRCSFDCLYCFSFFQRSLKKYNPITETSKLYTEELPSTISKKTFMNIFMGKSTSQTFKQFEGYIQNRMVMQWGGMSDPFDIFEKRYGVGLDILNNLYEIEYPICFSTKGIWWLDDERYACLFRGNDFWNVKMSIINLDSGRASQMERGVSTPMERLEAINRLVTGRIGKGGEGLHAGVTLRLRPFIIGYSDINDEYLDLIELAVKAGITAVSTEFLCIEGRTTAESRERFNAMSEICNIDIIDFYRRNSPNAAGYMRLNWKIKEPYVNKMHALCDKLGIRFYVSDAHHKDRCNNGCCCGLPESWNYSRGQFTHALVVAKEYGKVYFQEIEKGMPDEWRTQSVVTACGLNVARGNPRDRARFRTFSIQDYIRYIWNHPNHPRSPYKYFHGLLVADAVDDEDNVVYRYKPY